MCIWDTASKIGSNFFLTWTMSGWWFLISYVTFVSRWDSIWGLRLIGKLIDVSKNVVTKYRKTGSCLGHSTHSILSRDSLLCAMVVASHVGHAESQAMKCFFDPDVGCLVEVETTYPGLEKLITNGGSAAVPTGKGGTRWWRAGQSQFYLSEERLSRRYPGFYVQL